MFQKLFTFLVLWSLVLCSLWLVSLGWLRSHSSGTRDMRNLAANAPLVVHYYVLGGASPKEPNSSPTTWHVQCIQVADPYSWGHPCFTNMT
jgi:hypothetical protein